jgi:hypothetical protein
MAYVLYCVTMTYPYNLNFRYLTRGRWQYRWTTEKDEDGLYWMGVFKLTDYGRAPKKVLSFKKRASAKRSAYRNREAHIRRNSQQRIASKCHSCGEHTKLKGDYLCGPCRFGY